MRNKIALSLLPALILLLPTAVTADIAIEGSVEAPEYTALAGARVRLFPLRSAFEAGTAMLAGGFIREATVVTRTGDRGRFRLEAPGDGLWKVVVDKDGFVPMQYAPLALTAPVELSPVRLRRNHGAPLRIVTAEAELVAGVWVLAESPEVSRWLQDGRGWKPPSRLGRTDTAGRVTLPRAEGESLEVLLLAVGQTPTARSHITGGDLRFDPAAAKRWIEVRNRAGEAVEGVLARTGPMGAPAGVTGPDGRVLLPTRPDGSLDALLLTDAGHRRIVRLPPADSSDQRAWVVQLEDPVTVYGRVVQRGTGEPLAGALVWSGIEPARFTRTDEEGRYRFGFPNPERPWLQAEAAGYLPRQLGLEPEHLGTGRAPTLALRTPVSLLGEVVDPAGKPISGVRIEASPEKGGRGFVRPDTTADRTASGEDGRFQLTGLAPGRGYRLRVSRPGFTTVTATAAAPSETSRSEGSKSPEPPPSAAMPASPEKNSRPAVHLVLTPRRTAFGYVLDTAEKPVTDALVTLGVAGWPQPSRQPGRDEIATDPTRDLTDEQGRFEIAEIPASSIDLSVRAEGFLSVTVRGVEIPSAGSSADLGTVVLVRGERLAGRVVDETGVGVTQAGVYLIPSGRFSEPESLGDEEWRRLTGGRPAAVTGSGGQFVAEGLPGGEQVHLLVRHPGYAVGWVKGVQIPSRAPLTIVLEPGFEVAGQVIDESGKPVAGAEVRLELTEEPAEPGMLPPQPAVRLQRTDTGGRFALSGVRPGAASLHVTARGFVPPEPLVMEIPRTEVTPLTVMLDRGHVLEGTVATPEGEPIADVRVSTDEHAAYSDGEGFYRIAGLPAGPSRVDANHPHYRRQTQEIEIEPGLNRLDLTFEPGQPVTGRVVDEEGAPVPGARLTLGLEEVGATLRHEAITAADGSFELPSVADGQYRLEVEKAGFAGMRSEEAVRVAGEPVEELEVVLTRGIRVAGHLLGLGFDQLARVEVRAEREGVRSVPGRVDYEGRYEVDDLGPGSWLLQASLPGGRRHAQTRLLLRGSDQDVQRDLEFESRLTLSGRVLLRGKPVQGAKVSLNGYEMAVFRTVRTDRLGEFRLEDLVEGAYHLGLADGAELLIHNRQIVLDDDREIVIDLQPARVGGRVIEQREGSGVADALVILHRQAERGGEGMLTTASQADGSFLFPRVPPGRYRVTVRKDGYAVTETELALAAASEVDDLRLEVRATQGLVLNVRLAFGGLPPYLTVAVRDSAGRTLLQESRPVTADGRVLLPTVPAGTWELLASAPGTVTRAVTVSTPGEPVSLLLEPAARLRVQVPSLASSDLLATLILLGPDQQPFTILETSRGLVNEWTLTAGSSTVGGVPAGPWTLRVTSGDGQVWSAGAMALPGVETVVVLE